MQTAFQQAKNAIETGDLKKALADKSHKDAETALSPALEAMEKKLKKSLPSLLKKMLEAGGEAGAQNLHEALTGRALRAAAPSKKTSTEIRFEFDVTDPNAVDWIEKHGLELIDDITKTTRERLRDILTTGFEEGHTVDEMTASIDDVIDDEARAEVIARTETMTASNEGQQEAWSQAVDAGLLTGTEKQVWIVTPDDRLCPICEALGETEPVGLDETFQTEDGEFDGPPAHPNCRCALGLQL